MEWPPLALWQPEMSVMTYIYDEMLVEVIIELNNLKQVEGKADAVPKSQKNRKVPIAKID